MKKRIKYYYLKSLAPKESKRWFLVRDYKCNFIEGHEMTVKDDPEIVKFTDYKKAVEYKNRDYSIFSNEFDNYKVKIFRRYYR